ncbi:MAG TPA: kelch repeat-containing protein [Candidatus Eremiobacteraceae bacterium]|nr:kelch repeat-containing protein [Candidatus Eremiobacteraceae bacterium]
MNRLLYTCPLACAFFVLSSGYGAALAATGTWTTTGSMHVARISPIAVTLPDGRVLVAGGFNNPNSFASAELWDPATGMWSRTGSMSVDRVGATLTVLQTGKVLVAGGETSQGVTNRCELYDPSTGKWSRTGSMGTARMTHTATLMTDGRVLVVGGVGANSIMSLSSTEIYNPATGRWRGASFMPVAREGHAASLMSNGDVMVTGGDPGFITPTEGSVEVYDPAHNIWNLAGRMTSSRFFHTQITLRDGTIIVAGGAYGDEVAYDPFPSTDRFDPSTGTWSAVGDMNVVIGGIPKVSGRVFYTSALLGNGMVLAAGGIGYTHDAQTFRVLRSAELFDPATSLWTLTPDMQVERDEQAMVTLSDGRAMVIGGGTRRGATATAEIFTLGMMAREAFLPRAPLSARRSVRLPAVTRSIERVGDSPTIGSFALTGSLNVARAGAPATLLRNGKVLVEGCTQPFTTGGASAELFDPATGKWSRTGSMHFGRCRHSAALLPDGRVLVVGGDAGNVWRSTAEIYDPSTGQWTVAGIMNSPRTLGALIPLGNGTFIAPAGASVGTIPRDSADVYDPSTNTFTSTPSLNISRYAFGATELADGRALVEGGTSQDALQTLTCELYDPVTNVWTFTQSIHGQSANLVLLDDGHVLATDEINPPTSQLFDPTSGSWTGTAGGMNVTRIADTATLLLDGRVLVVGGQGPTMLVKQSEIYDPTTQHWTLDANLNIARWVQSAVRLADGRVLVAGGLSPSFVPIRSAEIYTP